MAQLITIANQKGGVGKSTVTLLAATALSQPPFSYDVAVVDIDPQQSIARRRGADIAGHTDAVPFTVYGVNFATFARDARTYDARHQIIFVDVAGKLDTAAGSDSEAVQVLQFVDLVLVPFTPGNFTVEATLDYIEAVRGVQQLRPELHLVAFRNMHRERSRHGRQLAGELADLSRLASVPIMEVPLKRYSDFEDADSLASLYSPTTTNPARANFTAWCDELNELLTN